VPSALERFARPPATARLGNFLVPEYTKSLNMRATTAISVNIGSGIFNWICAAVDNNATRSKIRQDQNQNLRLQDVDKEDRFRGDVIR
jgi:hypothetical protein